ncbi:unnamed protein product [Amoebophrya sp. A120]|nr:unnamed protein product [Amoebophrya sp. A120]|eukprot:GSA120T00020209001.1
MQAADECERDDAPRYLRAPGEARFYLMFAHSGPGASQPSLSENVRQQSADLAERLASRPKHESPAAETRFLPGSQQGTRQGAGRDCAAARPQEARRTPGGSVPRELIARRVCGSEAPPGAPLHGCPDLCPGGLLFPRSLYSGHRHRRRIVPIEYLGRVRGEGPNPSVPYGFMASRGTRTGVISAVAFSLLQLSLCIVHAVAPWSHF